MAAALAALICVAAVAVPWARLPRAAQAVPPLAVLPVLVLLEDAGGGASSGIAPLVIVPVFWLALYGSGRELLVAIGAVALTFGIPLMAIGAPDYPAAEWKRLVLWVLAAGLIGLTAHRLVRTVREGVRSGDALKTAIVESALAGARLDPRERRGRGPRSRRRPRSCRARRSRDRAAVLIAGPLGYFVRTRGLLVYLVLWAVIFPVQTVVVHAENADDIGVSYFVINAVILAVGVGLNALGARLRERRQGLPRAAA